jgi:regulator of sigma E protease
VTATALYIVPILALLILVHELGHFFAARLFGIKVLEFGIGLPPRLLGIRRGEVLYSINLIPIGGFVRVLGEESRSLDPGSLLTKSRFQRAVFFAAGALMNLLLAVLLTTVLVAARGEPVRRAYVAEVVPGSPAAEAGWQAGDRFVEVAGRPVESVEHLLALTEEHAGRPMPVTLLRGNQQIETLVVPRRDPPPGQGPTGIRVTEAARARVSVAQVERFSPAEAAGLQPGDELASIGDYPIDDLGVYALSLERYAGQAVPVVVRRGGQEQVIELMVPVADPAQSHLHVGLVVRQDVLARPVPWWQLPLRGTAHTFEILGHMIRALGMLLRGEASLSGIAGPIGMGQLTSEILAISPEPVWVTLANLTILLSLNLAVLNLIPFPALDGGRLLFVAIEAVRRRRIAPEKEGLVHLIGFVILLTFMFFIAFVDVGRLLSGEPLIR